MELLNASEEGTCASVEFVMGGDEADHFLKISSGNAWLFCVGFTLRKVFFGLITELFEFATDRTMSWCVAFRNVEVNVS